MAGCSSPEKMKDVPDEMVPVMSPKVLVLKGKTVEGKVSGRFPAKYFHKKAKLDMSPVMLYSGQQKVLATWQYQGEDITDNRSVINFENGGSFGGTFSFPYEDSMMQSKVELRLTLLYNDKEVPFAGNMPLGVGIDVTQNLVEVEPKPAIMPHNYARNGVQQLEAQFNFDIQKPNISRSQFTREDVKAFQKALADLKGNSKAELKGVTVNAYASPDGPVDLNENLYKGRGANTESWIESNLRKARVSGDLVKIGHEDTDWDGFKKMVEASDIEDKDMILRVLSMYSDPDTRNKEMHNMGKVFSEIAEKVLPKLRRSTMVADIEMVGKSDEEMKSLVEKKQFGSLTLAETLYAATLYNDDLTIQESILASKVSKNDVRVYNNLAANYLLQGKKEEAKEMLDKASAIDAVNPYVLNNLGVLEMYAGNVEEAKKLFLRAIDAGKAPKENLGSIAIADGEYSSAVDYLGGTKTFNEGLALLLSDKQEAAKNVLAEQKSAKAYYLLSILGVRAADEKMVIDNMRSAVSMDASLKERAKKDVVFASYMQNEGFAALLK
ncbi:MAG: hypothetical protein CSA97_04935 [Bacteroidetes bacterium]|nr:MAG: hypothetical protein CSA97_04935 [Bacteroidota bacterium]